MGLPSSKSSLPPLLSSGVGGSDTSSRSLYLPACVASRQGRSTDTGVLHNECGLQGAPAGKRKPRNLCMYRRSKPIYGSTAVFPTDQPEPFACHRVPHPSVGFCLDPCEAHRL